MFASLPTLTYHCICTQSGLGFFFLAQVGLKCQNYGSVCKLIIEKVFGVTSTMKFHFDADLSENTIPKIPLLIYISKQKVISSQNLEPVI